MHNKNNTNLWKNIKYVYGLILKKDIILFIFSILDVLINSCLYYSFSYLLKIIIEDLELNAEFEVILVHLLILTVLMLILSIFKDFIKNTCMWRWDKFYFNFLVYKNDKVMNIDYQKFEDPNFQNCLKKADMALGFYNGFGGLYFDMKKFLESIISTLIASFIITNMSFYLLLFLVFFVIVKYIKVNKTFEIDKKEYIDSIAPYKKKQNYISLISKNIDIGKDIRLYGMKNFIMNENENLNLYIEKKYSESQNRWFKKESFLKVIAILEEIILYSFLVFEVYKNKINIGEFTFLLTSVRTLSLSLTNSFAFFAKIKQHSRVTDDLRLIMGYNQKDKEQKLDILYNDYEIEFKNVYFKYPNQKDYALKNISFIIKPKEKIALVGMNGAGKTTIIKLLMGLYSPEKGQILLNGTDILKLNKKEYFKLFAPVFQDVNYFAFDIATNVSMTDEEHTNYNLVDDCIFKAGLKDKVNSLELGYKTFLSKQLNDEGIELSGGEKQKLLLARALYKESNIIILDEPTSALDALAEDELYNRFNTMILNKSAIFISHRLSSTKFCDKIILLKNGVIIEEGTHYELIKNSGEYKKMYDVQSQYYKDEVYNEN